jgi:hypothetical protein
MVRRNSDSAGDDKAKVRILFAEVEGNNETVQEALRTMVSAMSRPARVVHFKPNGEPPALTQPDLIPDGVEEVLDSEDVAEEPRQTETNSGRKQRGSGPKIDRNAGIALVHDLDFRPEGCPTLREFFADRSPTADMEQILVVLYFMQHKMRISKIGANHIITGLKDVGKSIPLDLKQTIRNMRGKKAWVKFSDIEDISTATAGDNHVNHDMGKKS